MNPDDPPESRVPEIVALAVAALFLFVVFPRGCSVADDAAFNHAVKKPFLDNGVKLP